MAKNKLVVIKTNGPLPELGGINGPIINPCLIDIPTIQELLNGHKKVVEVNPDDYTDRVRLTSSNFKLTIFREAKPVQKAYVAPEPKQEKKVVVEEKVVEKKQNKKVASDFTKK